MISDQLIAGLLRTAQDKGKCRKFRAEIKSPNDQYYSLALYVAAAIFENTFGMNSKTDIVLHEE